MLRFKDFEALGLRVAAVSDRSDGDCAAAGGEVGFRAFAAACAVDSGSVRVARQVHGKRILAAEDGPWPVGGEPEADGLVTGVSGVPIGVRVADCVPVFLFDPERGAGGLFHAGREGTFAGVAKEGLRALVDGGSRAESVHALIGPSAGPCCYEVSEALAAAWRSHGLPVQGRNLDLWGGNTRQLEGAGVPEGQITNCKICTICDGRFHSHRDSQLGDGRFHPDRGGGRFHSHRGDGEGGRNLALMMI